MSFIKKIFFLLVLISAGASVSNALDRSGDQGYGILVGRPTGLTAKVWLDNRWAFDGVVGVASSELNLHADLLFHEFEWARRAARPGNIFDSITSSGDFPVYFGIGPKILFEDDEEFGIRFPLGLAFLPHSGPWEFFGEFAPVFRLTPDAGFNADFGIGLRYYFRPIRPSVGLR